MVQRGNIISWVVIMNVCLWWGESYTHCNLLPYSCSIGNQTLNLASKRFLRSQKKEVVIILAQWGQSVP